MSVVIANKDNIVEILDAVGITTGAAMGMILAYRYPCPNANEPQCSGVCPFISVLADDEIASIRNPLCPLYRAGLLLRGISTKSFRVDMTKVRCEVGEL